MIESRVDKAIAALLSTISGLNVVTGMQDNEPNLVTPFCAVYSAVQNAVGRQSVSELLTTIVYESISGPNAVADVEATMTAIDAVLSTQPSSGTLLTLPLSGLTYLAWERIPKTQQDVGDRRRNIRELQVFAQAA